MGDFKVGDIVITDRGISGKILDLGENTALIEFAVGNYRIWYTRLRHYDRKNNDNQAEQTQNNEAKIVGKEITTIYKLSPKEIEQSLLDVLRKKYPELDDEFEGKLEFSHTIRGENSRIEPRHLHMTLTLKEERD